MLMRNKRRPRAAVRQTSSHLPVQNPVRLTNEQITEFQRIYMEAFGVPVSREEAIEQGLKLVGMMRAFGKRRGQPE